MADAHMSLYIWETCLSPIGTGVFLRGSPYPGLRKRPALTDHWCRRAVMRQDISDTLRRLVGHKCIVDFGSSVGHREEEEGPSFHCKLLAVASIARMNDVCA